jgi:hypothetical protein
MAAPVGHALLGQQLRGSAVPAAVFQVAINSRWRSYAFFGHAGKRRPTLFGTKLGGAHRHLQVVALLSWMCTLASSTMPNRSLAEPLWPGHSHPSDKTGRPSAVGTLVERHSRYVLLFPLPDGFTAERMRPALTAAILRLPQQLRRSLTWDHGREMAEHAQFTVDSGV